MSQVSRLQIEFKFIARMPHPPANWRAPYTGTMRSFKWQQAMCQKAKDETAKIEGMKEKVDMDEAGSNSSMDEAGSNSSMEDLLRH